MNPSEVPKSKRTRLTLEAERNLPHEHEGVVVIPKKRRKRGAPIPKIQVRWRHLTFPCHYSDRLTPAMLVEAIRLSPQIRQDTLAKATLTPPNNLSATLHLHVTLCSQGIFAGDIVTLVTRHARVYDPYGVQHFVAYRDEDKIQYFLSVLQDISPTPFLSELMVWHESSPLEPTSRFQDCNLPQEPSLHVRFRSHSGGHPLQELVWTESTPTAGNAPEETGIPSPIATGSKGHLPQTYEPKHGLGYTGMNLSSSSSQIFIKDPGGRTHVLLFRPTDSIATNLLRYSAQLPLPPFADLYIQSGRQVLETECTGRENGLHFEPHLEILLRCKGGMRGGIYGSSKDKGRGQRASAGSSSGMGGGQITAENGRTPPGKVERGRGRGGRGSDRRPTLIQTQPHEDMDDMDRYAFITARRETLQTSTSQLCQELWATSRIIPGYGTPPPAAAQGKPQEDQPMAPERPPPSEISAGQAPPPSKKKNRRTIARKLHLDKHPSPLAQDINTVDHHDKAEEPGLPTRVGSSSDAILEADGVMFLGPRNENPDQPIRDPFDIQGALPSLELEAYTTPPSNDISPGQESVFTSGNTLPAPPEASMEAPTQSDSDSTSTLTDNHVRCSPGSSGYTTYGSENEPSKKDSTRSNLSYHKPLPLQEARVPYDCIALIRCS